MIETVHIDGAVEAVQGFPAIVGGALEHDLSFIFQGFFLHLIDSDAVLTGSGIRRPFPVMESTCTDPAEAFSHEIELSSVGRCVGYIYQAHATEPPLMSLTVLPTSLPSR